MMANKKELEQQLKEKEEARSALYADNIDLNRKLGKLESETKDLKQQKEQITEQCNQRADFIKQILNIILGEAESNSKYQVIRDMFLEQIKGIESIPEGIPMYKIGYPSNRVNEDGGIW